MEHKGKEGDAHRVYIPHEKITKEKVSMSRIRFVNRHLDLKRIDANGPLLIILCDIL